jgi:hypothetical protein
VGFFCERARLDELPAHQEPHPGTDGPHANAETALAGSVPPGVPGPADHITLVAAVRTGSVEEALEVSRKHVGILHRTIFMGWHRAEAERLFVVRGD